ncbi:NADH:flavin oxidoreductase/NADH oxidase [Pseudonocardia sp. N23]|uniref:oxidoreductase n=1 Tax=Pseudonocardia sp. N23 TaxID=1987376 RepID=UPI000C033451|nr:NADH:flavin oxidoreductase/NADH oxidase [Pseudonocardia sp. N23]GAY10985.1 NADH:flavin oxidoreductase [Pseudonocardia sp. N23]
MTSHLFSPFEIRGVALRNRVVVSPMWQYLGVDGAPTVAHTVHLGRLAEGGPGLTIVEGTTVDRRGRGTVGDLGLWQDDLVPGHAGLVDIIRAGGSVPGIQLIHAGRKGRRNPPWAPEDQPVPDPADWPVLAPSAIPVPVPGAAAPEAMSLRDIEETAHSWAQAARRARDAGYDVIDVQAAHGYLLHTFLSPLTNRRTDAYGGSSHNRARLLIEVVDAIRTEWPDDKALFVRLSCVDVRWGLDRTVELVRELRCHAVDVIDCTSGGLTGRPTPDAPAVGYGYQVPYAEQVRVQTGSPTMAVGMIVHARQAEEIVACGRADLVALGRELLHNPNWPLDAARKLGVADPYAAAPARTAHWLRKRDESFPGLAPSTMGDLDVATVG